jgi:hypothetical protein
MSWITGSGTLGEPLSSEKMVSSYVRKPMDLETVVGKEDHVGVDYDVKRLRLPVLPTCLSPALLRKQTPDLRILFFDLPELFPR